VRGSPQLSQTTLSTALAYFLSAPPSLSSSLVIIPVLPLLHPFRLPFHCSPPYPYKSSQRTREALVGAVGPTLPSWVREWSSGGQLEVVGEDNCQEKRGHAIKDTLTRQAHVTLSTNSRFYCENVFCKFSSCFLLLSIR